MNDPTTKPNIFLYDNYRVFLKDAYHSFKTQKTSFSFRYFSRQAGFTSPNFLKLVIEGKRNLSNESIQKFARVFKLNKEESLFFNYLVHLNQSATTEEKKSYAEQIIRSRLSKKIYPLREIHYNYYSKWYSIPIREIIALKNFIEDSEWIAKQITPAISSGEVRKTLQELQQIGLIRRSETGKLVQTEEIIATQDEVTSSSIAQFHQEMLKRATESIDRFGKEEREISCVTLALSKSSFQKIKSMIQEFKKDLLRVASEEKNSDQVFQINFQVFPLTRSPTQPLTQSPDTITVGAKESSNEAA